MDKNHTQFDASKWYELWMQQSNLFFTSAEKYLKEVFSDENYLHPENYMDTINTWLNDFKKQWDTLLTTDTPNVYQNYIKMMNTMGIEASQLMLNEWLKLARSDKPITSIRELYELWLNACHEIYQQYLRKNEYQKAYAEMINSALKFWKVSVPN